MADSQVPWGVGALGGTITEPSWRSKPSWYLLTTEDRMIPGGPAREVRACRVDGRRGRRQPRGLRLAASSGERPDRDGGQGHVCRCGHRLAIDPAARARPSPRLALVVGVVVALDVLAAI